jgi:glutathione synthase/RimK-type ligase-like ATP-grasp enzyme
MHVSLITYDGLPNLDPDDALIADEIKRRGHDCTPAIWNDASVDWSKFDISIMRSAWDYHLHTEKFYAWLEDVSKMTKLLNSPQLMRWSSHKSYLKELHDKGLPVVETLWLEKGGKSAEIVSQLSWPKAIIKPAIGLATFGVGKFDLEQGESKMAEAHADQLAKTQDVMFQPFIKSVEDYGERALMFVGGKYTHSVRKSSFQKLAPAGHAGEEAVEGDLVEIAIAEKVVASLDAVPLYARVDLVRNEKNEPLLLELELVEPSLFISCQPAVALKFVDALEPYFAVHKV